MCDAWCVMFQTWFFLRYWLYESRGDQKKPIRVISDLFNDIPKLIPGGSTQYLARLHSSYCFGVRGDMWHLTPDTWQVTHDILHVLGDTQGVMNIFSKFSGLYLLRFGREGEGFIKIYRKRVRVKGLNKQLINVECVRRTALGSSGLLNIVYGKNHILKGSKCLLIVYAISSRLFLGCV